MRKQSSCTVPVVAGVAAAQQNSRLWTFLVAPIVAPLISHFQKQRQHRRKAWLQNWLHQFQFWYRVINKLALACLHVFKSIITVWGGAKPRIQWWFPCRTVFSVNLLGLHMEKTSRGFKMADSLQKVKRELLAWRSFVVLKTVRAASVRKKGGNYAPSLLKKTNDTLFHPFIFFNSHAQNYVNYPLWWRAVQIVPVLCPGFQISHFWNVPNEIWVNIKIVFGA